MDDFGIGFMMKALVVVGVFIGLFIALVLKVVF